MTWNTSQGSFRRKCGLISGKNVKQREEGEHCTVQVRKKWWVHLNKCADFSGAWLAQKVVDDD